MPVNPSFSKAGRVDPGPNTYLATIQVTVFHKEFGSTSTINTINKGMSLFMVYFVYAYYIVSSSKLLVSALIINNNNNNNDTCSSSVPSLS